MRQTLLALILVGTGALAAPAVLAVGSGSGGAVSAPSCDADTWTCGGWGACAENGRQVRSCALSYDCPYAATPWPAEEQACTPPPPAIVPKPEAAAPADAPKPAPACSADAWNCDAWPDSCDIYGNEYRACRLVSDCPTAETTAPVSQRRCSRLQCGNKTTLRERIFCRLNLAPAGMVRELEIEYLPEECRAAADSAQRQACIARYKSYQPCWSVPAGESRFACARDILRLGPMASEEVKNCQGQTGSEQVACKAAVREKVFRMIKFRLYDLEERAEQLAERGADLDAVADLEALIESKKQAFDAAQTKAERRQIIFDVRQAWQDFLNRVKDQVK